MAELIRVGMADYKVGRSPATIISYGLGSCIGISLYDPQAKVGGLLHIMLPDSKQARPSDNPAKFADTGLPLMLKDVLALGAVKRRLVAKMAGGAQMFAFANATDIMRVGARNAAAAKEADTIVYLFKMLMIQNYITPQTFESLAGDGVALSVILKDIVENGEEE